MFHLQNHLWVEEVRRNASGGGYAQIMWQWSGQQPPMIDASRRGRITFYWDDEDPAGPELSEAVIETITVYTHLPMYSMQMWLGEASTGTANLRPDGNLGYAIAYNLPHGIINLSAEMPCPANLLTYWYTPTRVTMSVGRGSSPYVSPEEMVQIC
jgi:hypothetical protein